MMLNVDVNYDDAFMRLNVDVNYDDAFMMLNVVAVISFYNKQITNNKALYSSL